ncbi:hypothetical protein TGVEG_224180 [Toxoplasma gondii VEG]|uniref:BTB domain-containing protein n=1 Tax=Toxoplasma gondii (strain ATCC 50861 / VEG) TaxID=432359 RepID=V4YW20_TOXGV|nr:hypothetical protein TGVEG_224180 [Toxoplasma gondii VEG]
MYGALNDRIRAVLRRYRQTVVVHQDRYSQFFRSLFVACPLSDCTITIGGELPSDARLYGPFSLSSSPLSTYLPAASSPSSLVPPDPCGLAHDHSIVSSGVLHEEDKAKKTGWFVVVDRHSLPQGNTEHLTRREPEFHPHYIEKRSSARGHHQPASRLRSRQRNNPWTRQMSQVSLPREGGRRSRRSSFQHLGKCDNDGGPRRNRRCAVSLASLLEGSAGLLKPVSACALSAYIRDKTSSFLREPEDGSRERDRSKQNHHHASETTNGGVVEGHAAFPSSICQTVAPTETPVASSSVSPSVRDPYLAVSSYASSSALAFGSAAHPPAVQSCLPSAPLADVLESSCSYSDGVVASLSTHENQPPTSPPPETAPTPRRRSSNPLSAAWTGSASQATPNSLSSPYSWTFVQSPSCLSRLVLSVLKNPQFAAVSVDSVWLAPDATVVNAHKLILACRSSFFRRQLSKPYCIFRCLLNVPVRPPAPPGSFSDPRTRVACRLRGQGKVMAEADYDEEAGSSQCFRSLPRAEREELERGKSERNSAGTGAVETSASVANLIAAYPCLLTEIIRYLYTDEMEVPLEDVSCFLTLANAFKLKDLRKRIEEEKVRIDTHMHHQSSRKLLAAPHTLGLSPRKDFPSLLASDMRRGVARIFRHAERQWKACCRGGKSEKEEPRLEAPLGRGTVEVPEEAEVGKGEAGEEQNGEQREDEGTTIGERQTKGKWRLNETGRRRDSATRHAEMGLDVKEGQGWRGCCVNDCTEEKRQHRAGRAREGRDPGNEEKVEHNVRAANEQDEEEHQKESKEEHSYVDVVLASADLCVYVGPSQVPFPCHRFIVERRSEYFATLLHSSFREVKHPPLSSVDFSRDLLPLEYACCRSSHACHSDEVENTVSRSSAALASPPSYYSSSSLSPTPASAPSPSPCACSPRRFSRSRPVSCASYPPHLSVRVSPDMRDFPLKPTRATVPFSSSSFASSRSSNPRGNFSSQCETEKSKEEGQRRRSSRTQPPTPDFDCVSVLSLPQVDVWSFALVLEYMYTDAIFQVPSFLVQPAKNRQSESLLRLIECGSMFLMPGLVSVCSAALSPLVDASNVCAVYRVADLLRLDRLVFRCASVMAEKIDSLLPRLEFHQLVLASAHSLKNREAVDSIPVVEELVDALAQMYGGSENLCGSEDTPAATEWLAPAGVLPFTGEDDYNDISIDSAHCCCQGCAENVPFCQSGCFCHSGDSEARGSEETIFNSTERGRRERGSVFLRRIRRLSTDASLPRQFLAAPDVLLLRGLYQEKVEKIDQLLESLQLNT